MGGDESKNPPWEGYQISVFSYQISVFGVKTNQEEETKVGGVGA